MRTINVYQFDELTDEAKKVAIEEARRKEKYYDMDCPTSEGATTIKGAAEQLGFKMTNWSIGADVQSSFVSLTHYDFRLNDLFGMRLRTWLLNNKYEIFYERQPQGKYMLTKSNYQRRSRITYVEHSCPFTGMCYDDVFLDPFRAFLKKPDSSTLEDLFKEGVRKVCKCLESEYEYYTSDEGIIEFLDGNDYEFTEKGKFI